MIALLVLMMVLAGCGNQQDTANSVPPEQNTETADKQAAQNKMDQTAADTKVMKDEFGDVEIPVNPKRVAGIYVEDYLLALGVTPVVQWYHPSWGKQDYLDLDVPTFDITGSMEGLLKASPDLIIVDGAVDAAKYELYSKIAPTYRLPESILQKPTKILKTIGDVLDIPEEAERALNEYNEKIADAKAKLKQAVAEETVAVLRLNIGDKTLALFGIENRFTGNLYKEMGLNPHPFVRDMTDYQAILSQEKIPELDADHIIVFPSNGGWDSEENREAMQIFDSPLWKSVPAVKNGHVYKADRTHWQSGAITANMMKVDDLLKWFVQSADRP
ncbi:ABC transporter substrate-binding protein [Paenibacillus glucanolyticus]|uniref:ABC transporter substrate-binding protein n=1 Tax=Paenibacillus glucanolyticus TaxID=59843 RepID=UPI002115E33C|nr:ABC transporter substrate-binding protein [Paenibacillus glucanolyticus]